MRNHLGRFILFVKQLTLRSATKISEELYAIERVHEKKKDDRLLAADTLQCFHFSNGPNLINKRNLGRRPTMIGGSSQITILNYVEITPQSNHQELPVVFFIKLNHNNSTTLF